MGFLLANFLLGVVTFLNLIYDVITLPFYHLLQSPRARRTLMRQRRAVKVSESSDEVVYGSVEGQEGKLVGKLHKNNVQTLHELFEFMANDEKKMNQPILGTRKVIKMAYEKDPNSNKQLKKLVLGDYEWSTIKEAAIKSRFFGLGLRELGVAPGSKVAIFADTRAEWLIAARGCFQHAMTMCTLYTNLGVDGIKHAITLTGTAVVITSQSLLPKLAKTLKSTKQVNLVVVFEEPWIGEMPKTMQEVDAGVSQNITFASFSQVIGMGSQSTKELVPPKPDDAAIIMFTSGSTGAPKGVIQTHLNLIAAFTTIFSTLEQTFNVNPEEATKEVYIAFLPLAHILEFLAENCILLLGIKVGFSSPYTLTDTGTAIKKGTKGDLAVLRPTMMCAVPVILDRIYKGIISKVQAKGAFSYKLLDYCVAYRARWRKRGYLTPVMDRIVFKKIREATGGRLSIIIAGGAPLSGITQDFIRQALGVSIMQGYGLTETCATATLMTMSDIGVGVVGGPLPRVQIKLRSWDEGSYTVKDEEGARGEVIIGGDHVAMGYYKLKGPETADFEVDSKGMRWFKTGDIGQIMPNGNLKIIDRKKDLVKLQMGEYVSLGKVESVLKLHSVVENMCVSARSSEYFCVAIIVPSKNGLLTFVEETLSKTGFTVEDLVRDQSVLDAIASAMMTFGLSQGLEKFEIPRKFCLVLDDWTPESGMVTAAMKLRRKPVEVRYKDDINKLYLQLNNNNDNELSYQAQKSVNI